MSKIQVELCNVAETDPKRSETRQEFLLRLALACNKLPDSVWDKLSRDAQNWVNNASDAANGKKTLPDFPDAVKEEEPTSTRRRVSAEEPKTAGTADYEPKLKDDVRITTKRDQVKTGKIVEMDEEVIVIKTPAGYEEDVIRDRIAKIEPLSGGKAKEEDEGPRDPKVGDLVTLTTKRDKVVTGDVVEITDELITLKVNGVVEDYMKDRVASIKIEGGRKAEAGTSRRSADKGETKTDTKEEGTRTRSTNSGVSVGTRIKELLIEDASMTLDEVGKALKKEGLEFRDATLSLNYSDVTKFLEMLKKAGKLK